MGYITLSSLVSDLDPKQQFTYYKEFKKAIREGKLQAVPTDGSVTIARAKSPLIVPEHLLPDDGRVQSWNFSTIVLMKEPRKGIRRLSVSQSELESGEVDFAEAAARYRASITPKEGAPKRGRRKEK